MATLEFWIQLENRPWDVCPNNIDRMTGQTIKEAESAPNDPVTVTIQSPGTGATRLATMYKPLRNDNGSIADALVLRRYLPPSPAHKGGKARPAWAVPDDRKVNPWDKNEPDPTDKGTMGTIPGPVIECNVGDKVVIHFSNRDQRTHPVTHTKSVQHTVHTEEEVDGFTSQGKPTRKKIKVAHDEVSQVEYTVMEPLPPEMRIHSLHPHGFAFTATSDGAYPLSPADKDQPISANESAAWVTVPGFSGNFKMGDRVPTGGAFTYTWIAGAPSEDDPTTIEPWPSTAGVWLYHDHSLFDMESVSLGAIGLIVIHNPQDEKQEVDIRQADSQLALDPEFLPGGSATGPVTIVPSRREPVRYQPPPTKALYLMLFHTLTGLGSAGGMLINGRQYLGNTPTLIAGPATLMRFGVIGMGNDFHTFHIHGHRWAIPGPDGTDPDTIQASPQIRAVTQFEDTRIFGPANSFVFTIREGSFMGARDDDPFGEFHMHCHVLMHMDQGMMGSLLIIPEGGGIASPLPHGVPKPMLSTAGAPSTSPSMDAIVESVDDCKWRDATSGTPETVIMVGGKVTWKYGGCPPAHTVVGVTNTSPFDNLSPPLNLSGPTPDKDVSYTFSQAGTFGYFCGIHTGDPVSKAGMWGIVHVKA